jgi:small GTP-binding protein
MIDGQSIDLKVVALGAASVGKTSLIHRYCNGSFRSDLETTIGAGFFTQTSMHGDTEVTLLLWDTAGEERFRSVAPSLLRGANGLILVYDLTQPNSFEELTTYLEMFLDTVAVDLSHELPVLVLGNKSDMDNPVIPRAQVQAWCQKNRVVHHFLVSAKTGDNVHEAVNTLVDSLLNPRQSTDRPTLQLTPIPATHKSACC